MPKHLENITTWNKLAHAYHRRFMNLDIYDQSYDLFCEMLGHGRKHILEIGCGPGNITRYLLHKNPVLKILGIDAAPDMIKLAREENPGATFKVMDARNIRELNTKFDAIVCGFCIPYLDESDCEKLLSDCSNLLGEEGILYLSFVEGDPAHSGYQEGSSGDRLFFCFHELAHTQHILSLNHFTIERVLKINYQKAQSETEMHTVLMAKLNA